MQTLPSRYSVHVISSWSRLYHTFSVKTLRSFHTSNPTRNDDMPTTNEKGEFVRPASAFRNFVTVDGSSGFKAAAGRYHLYVSLACPFAARTLIGRAIKGLEAAISVTVVDPKMGEQGWQFTDEEPGCELDPVNGKSRLREVYQIAEKGYDGRVSVPVLWDKEKKTIVNNESAEILRMFGSGVFDAFCATPAQKAINLYPEALRAKVDEINEFIYPKINNGVYLAGFGTTQEAYSKAVDDLFAAMDKVDDMLSKSRYLVGNTLTEADVRLVTTLFRFDTAYHGLFKCNRKMLIQYPNLWAYTRDVYQSPGVADTVDLYHINKHYWWSLATINPTRIVPTGPKLNFQEPHGREKVGQ